MKRHVRLPRSFYDRPTLQVAADLIGKVLVHRAPEGIAAGAIVEAEAYIGEDDPACHAAPGPTRRNMPLYGPPGHAYVYLNYGVHYLFNVVTEADGRPAAVLIRALEPVEGIPLMQMRRGLASTHLPDPMSLCRGPGNLTRALAIGPRHNCRDVCARGDLYLEDRGLDVGPAVWSPRIGISVGTEKPWRRYAIESPAVSGRRPGARPTPGRVR